MEAIVETPPLTESQLSPFEDSTQLLADPDALRARARRDGYLFFRGLLDPQLVLELRREVLKVMDRHGIHDSTNKLSGKLNIPQLHNIPEDKMRADVGISLEMYIETQQLPILHRLPHNPSLLKLFQTLFDEEVFVHPQHIMRVMTSHPVVSPTPPHQDFVHIQGTTDTWTAWFPVGDCPARLGSLAVLRGSHRNGCLPVNRAKGAGRLATQLCEHDKDWVGGDFAVGDVLTFSSLTVHQGLATKMPDDVRISMDVRYQKANDNIAPDSLTNHARVPWEEIYNGWQKNNADLKYYWAATHPRVIAPTGTIRDPSGPRRMC